MQLNVTTNHSCQEIPSQTHEESGQPEKLHELNSAKTLWSDKVELMDNQIGAIQSKGDKEKRDNKHLQETGNTLDTTENSGNPKARLDYNLNSMKLNVGKEIGGGSGALKEVENQDGSVAARIIEKGNGTVTPSKTGDILAYVDGVLVYALEKGQDQCLPTKLRKDIVC